MEAVIQNRRSIRKYRNLPVSRQLVEEVIRAGILAPSSKNRQPWKFIVVTGREKAAMLDVMRQGLLRERDRQALLPNSRQHLGGAEGTLRIMEQAPVTIFVSNTLGKSLFQPPSFEERVYEICNVQSIGAAMENMTLTATQLGLGSLWICDIFFAYQELCQWLRTEGTPLAALALGYAEESPASRPRKTLAEVVEWRE